MLYDYEILNTSVKFSNDFSTIDERQLWLPTFTVPKIFIMESTHFVIVDDDAINNRLCQLCIARHFGDVPIKSYQDPNLALRAIGSGYDENLEKPTVLFLDIQMPQINGWQFLDQFGAFPEAVRRQFKIYILSASTDRANIEAANNHPLVSGFLSKPLTAAAMERVFRTLPEDYGVRCFS